MDELQAGIECSFPVLPANGTERKFPRMDWYQQWGIHSRGDKLRVLNVMGKRANQIAPAPWLKITFGRAHRNCEDYEKNFLGAFRFVMLMAVVRFST